LTAVALRLWSTAAKIHFCREKVNKNIFVASCHSCEGELQKMESIALTPRCTSLAHFLGALPSSLGSTQARAVVAATINRVRFDDSVAPRKRRPFDFIVLWRARATQRLESVAFKI
jgi:hypothetical protein